MKYILVHYLIIFCTLSASADDIIRRNNFLSEEIDIRYGLINHEEIAQQPAIRMLNAQAPTFVPRAQINTNFIDQDKVNRLAQGMKNLSQCENCFGEKFCTNNNNARAIFDDAGLAYLSIVGIMPHTSIVKKVVIDNVQYQTKKSSVRESVLVEFYRI